MGWLRQASSGAENEGDQLWLEIPCRSVWKGFLEKEANPGGMELKGLVCKFVEICNLGGGVEIRNPANF